MKIEYENLFSAHREQGERDVYYMRKQLWHPKAANTQPCIQMKFVSIRAHSTRCSNDVERDEVFLVQFVKCE